MTADHRQPPEAGHDGGPRTAQPRTAQPRTAEERAADHAAIDRLAEDLVPALIAKLSASGLGEIEVGESSWTIRVRQPAEASAAHERRSSDRASRSQPGHAGHGHGPGSFEGHRSARDGRPLGATASASASGASSNGSRPHAAGDSAGSGTATARPAEPGPDPHRVVATSPAVGVFQPKADLKPGARVRNGDRLGAVDMLGIPQDVLAPADGILGASLVETGQAVEYGQELIVIELAARPAERSEA